jgi:uncharacterized protein YodC (DUF2158 family)
MDFPKGSIVRLKSGGPNMTVADYRVCASYSIITCVWYDEGKINQENVLSTTLDLVSLNKDVDISFLNIENLDKAIFYLASAYRELNELDEKLEAYRKLENPVVLHANLIRGFPAMLSKEQLLHLLGEYGNKEI